MGGQVIVSTAQETVLVHQVLDAPLFHEALGHIARAFGAVAKIGWRAFAPSAGVALVGADQVGLAVARLVGGNGVGLVHAQHVGGGGDVDHGALAVAVGKV